MTIELKKDIYFKDLIVDFKNKKKKGIVRIILPRGFNSSQNVHPLEKHLGNENIPCYFGDDGILEEKDYEIDLNKFHIVYNLCELTLENLVEGVKDYYKKLDSKKGIFISCNDPLRKDSLNLQKIFYEEGIKYFFNNPQGEKIYSIFLDLIKIKNI